ncbi:hypothetical protein [Vagococcus bubulae]|uniref:DUF3955 domain-containing protein n=1 Tax=Vagococcus bubulae TaxID=1977868 RepID=A0A429ZPK8_9ENTE|nr:hypothetical protein [Vagococcus bubulae]RST95650.1 hypothetical protein CBF36_02920 [Vagococcus bubulae]
MKKYYLISLATGLIMLFILQLLSYINYLLLDQGVMNGLLDKTLLLKTPLIIIPLIFIAFSIVGLIIDYLHHQK